MLKRVSRLILVSFSIAYNSCQIFLDVGDNIGRNFSSPEKSPFLEKHPVKNNVKLSALWVGHATVLIQIYDKVILTDPLFTNNVAEVLRRYVEPGLKLSYLDKIDAILISHSHSDHLSLGSLSVIEKKFPGCDIVFPEGVEEFLPDYKFKYHKMKMATGERKNYIGETITVNGIKITTVEAKHWGGKYGIDGKLWSNNGYSGFIIQYKDVTVFYTGDTAYDKNLFRFLGDHYNIDLDIVNIIYCDSCTQINKNLQHIYPMGAIKIFDDTKAKYMIPAHFGTFRDPDETINVLKKMYLTNDHYKQSIKILRIGEQFIFN